MENKEYLTQLMENLEKAMELSRGKQENIDQKYQALREETRILMVDEGKVEIEELKAAKTEFDEMTVNSLVEANQKVKEAKEKSEKEYQDKLVETIKRRKEIEDKLKTMKERGLSPEKIQWADQSATKALENVNNEMKEFQEKHFEKYNKLATWENNIDGWAIELGCEEKLKEQLETSIVKEPTVESSTEIAKDETNDKINEEKHKEPKQSEEIEQKIEKAQQEMDRANKDYKNIHLEAAPNVSKVNLRKENIDKPLNTFEKNNIINQVKSAMQDEIVYGRKERRSYLYYN